MSSMTRFDLYANFLWYKNNILQMCITPDCTASLIASYLFPVVAITDCQLSSSIITVNLNQNIPQYSETRYVQQQNYIFTCLFLFSRAVTENCASWGLDDTSHKGMYLCCIIFYICLSQKSNFVLHWNQVQLTKTDIRILSFGDSYCFIVRTLCALHATGSLLVSAQGSKHIEANKNSHVLNKYTRKNNNTCGFLVWKHCH